MIQKITDAIVQSQKDFFVKFLSANDTGETGGHQSGILISIKAKKLLFPLEIFSSIEKRNIKIHWNEDFFTESCFTYYESKGELRLTRLGRRFPFLTSEYTGALFILIQEEYSDYKAYILNDEENIENFLASININPVETNKLISFSHISNQDIEEKEIQKLIRQWNELKIDFPDSKIMSESAMNIENTVYRKMKNIILNPDQKIINWLTVEYNLFRTLEAERYREIITKGFKSVDEFIILANTVLNRRKSRAGKSLEHHLKEIFLRNELKYTSQATTEGKKKPDFLFPSQEAYHDYNFPIENLTILAAKTTCKDRWRQILNEADRLRGETKFLCTLQQGISKAQIEEMEREKVKLVVPKMYHTTFPLEKRNGIWTIQQFIEYVKRKQEETAF